MRRRSRWAAVWAACVLFSPGAARAAWLKAETDRFIVYSDGRASELSDFVTKLTGFDAMLRTVYPRTANAPAGGKLVVYLARRSATMLRITPNLADGVVGYYRAAGSGEYAVVSRAGVWVVGDVAVDADEVLFHEYMHRFMYENFPAAYPAWLIEAYAEYFQTAVIRPDAVDLGGLSEARALSLRWEDWLPMDRVFGRTVAETHRTERNLFYAQAWLFLHYMLSDPARTAQLAQALTAIGEGADPVKAMHEATGMDGHGLTNALAAYAGGSLPMRRIAVSSRSVAPPQIVTLSPASDDLLPERQRLTDGVAEKDQPAFLAEIRQRAARYPGDRLADLTLAKAETEFGDLAAGQAILARWLAAEPNSAEVLRLAAEGHLSAAKREPSTAADQSRTARALLAKAHALDKRDFRPLFLYAQARSAEPDYPSDNDLNVLLLAHRLAPGVQAISYNAGAALISKRRYDAARELLLLVANSPHGGELSEQAQALLDSLSPKEAAPPSAADAPS